jgi:hypothetical protein
MSATSNWEAWYDEAMVAANEAGYAGVPAADVIRDLACANRTPPTFAARDVLAERQRQISVEGWTPEHDDMHDNRELAHAAACYAYPELTGVQELKAWPWAPGWWKPKGYRRNLVKAGALILAEIERLDRNGELEV